MAAFIALFSTPSSRCQWLYLLLCSALRQTGAVAVFIALFSTPSNWCQWLYLLLCSALCQTGASGCIYCSVQHSVKLVPVAVFIALFRWLYLLLCSALCMTALLCSATLSNWCQWLYLLLCSALCQTGASGCIYCSVQTVVFIALFGTLYDCIALFSTQSSIQTVKKPRFYLRLCQFLMKIITVINCVRMLQDVY